MRGPFLGRRQDLELLAASGLEDAPEARFNNERGDAWYSFSYRTYLLSLWLMMACKGSLYPLGRDVNKAFEQGQSVRGVGDRTNTHVLAIGGVPKAATIASELLGACKAADGGCLTEKVLHVLQDDDVFRTSGAHRH